MRTRYRLKSLPQHRGGNRRNWWPLLLIGICIVAIVGGVVFSVRTPDYHRTSPPEVARNIHGRAALDSYLKYHGEDQWIIQEQHGKNVRAEIRSLEEIRNTLQSCLRRFTHALILDMRGTMMQSFYPAKLFPTWNPEDAIRSLHPVPADRTPVVTLVFYGRSTLRHPILDPRGSFFYDFDRRAIFMPARRVTFPWFCARGLHEVGHAYLHQVVQAESATAPSMSDSWILEEIAMYELESAILDEWTGGRYLKAMRELVRRAASSSVTELLQRVTLEQLLALDALFPRGSHGEAQTRAGSYVFTAALMWALDHSSEVPVIAAYRNAAAFSHQQSDKH